MATASIDTVSTNQIKVLLQCSICFETVKDPRTLPCFHSFCKGCLESFVKSQRGKGMGLNCAKCRTQFTLTEGGVEEMKQNHFVLSILDLLAIQNQTTLIPCSYCPEVSVARCVTCEEFMCKGCLNDHNIFKKNNNHLVLSMSELSKPENKNKIKGTSLCQEHIDQKLRLYCVTCEKIICQDCMHFGDHPRPEHDCSLLESVAKTRALSLKTDSKTLDQMLIGENKRLRELNEYSQSLDDNLKATEQEINNNKKKILRKVEQILNEKSQALINDARKTFNKRKKATQIKIAWIEIYVSKVNGTADMTKGVVENGNEEEIVSTQKDIQKNVKKLQNEKPKGEFCFEKDEDYKFEQTETILTEEIVAKLEYDMRAKKEICYEASESIYQEPKGFIHSKESGSYNNNVQSPVRFDGTTGRRNKPNNDQILMYDPNTGKLRVGYPSPHPDRYVALQMNKQGFGPCSP